MRFSLTTLVLMVFWLGTLLGVWMWRKPWIETGILSTKIMGPLEFDTPDGERHFFFKGGPIPRIRDRKTGQVFWEYIPHANTTLLHFYFRSNDDFVVLEYVGSPLDQNMREVRYHRRFPEWWWGHLYRPEVWLANVLSAVLLWRAAKARRVKA